MARRRTEAGAPPILTPRQMEILRMMEEGATYRDAAERLGISARTVSVHVDRLFLRLGVRDRAQAIAEARRSGLL